MQVISKKNPTLDAIEDLMYGAFTNNGIVGLETEDKDVVRLGFNDLFDLPKSFKAADLEMSDVVSTHDLTRFMGTSITRVVQEALEPNLIVTQNLFQSVRYDGPSRSVEIGSMGAFEAGVIPEGSEYPTVAFSFGEGDMVRVAIEKHGLKMRVTSEVIEENLFDVFGLWLRMAGRALGRHKEEYGIKLINDYGYDLFDNVTPANAKLGATNGRGIDGAKNNTMNTDDIFEMYAWLQLRGYQPDTLVMNPLAYKMFMSDPEAREIVLKGATLATNSLPQGHPAAGFGVGHKGLGLNTKGTGVQLVDPNKPAGNNPFVSSLNPLGSTLHLPPSYLPTPMKVIVTPYIPYTPGPDETGIGAVTNVVMADSTRCGLILEKEGVAIDQWDDPERDIKAMKLREKYGMALFEQGKGVGVARNVTIGRNYVFDNVNQQTLA